MGQTTRVFQVPAGQRESLRRALEAGVFEFRSVPHAVFSAKGEGAVVTLYTSGKLVVQGSDPDFFAARFLPELASAEGKPGSSSKEDAERGDAIARIDVVTIGSDETGKGDYFGPLVVAAVRLEPEEARKLEAAGVMDSKKLTDKRALQLGAALRQGVAHALVSLEPEDYNRAHAEAGNLNLVLAGLHAEAIAELAQSGDRVVVDQFASANRMHAALGDLDVRLEQAPRAERNPAVAAASILARAEFLVRLRELSSQWEIDFPKGAGPAVDEAGVRFLETHEGSQLSEVAKLHFKNTGKIQAKLESW